MPADHLSDTDIDVVVLQRPEELELAERWLRRRPGKDVPAVYVEHNTPGEHAANTRHPMSGQPDIPLVHVTHFNQLSWDNTACRSTVIPHGIVDPGQQYTGELARAGALINEPLRRWRVTGTDLLPAFGAVAPVDVLRDRSLRSARSLRGRLRDRGPRTARASLRTRPEAGVSPHRTLDVAGALLARSDALGDAGGRGRGYRGGRCRSPRGRGDLDDLDELTTALRDFVNDADLAAFTGKLAREYALNGLDAFLRRWDAQLAELAR